VTGVVIAKLKLVAATFAVMFISFTALGVTLQVTPKSVPVSVDSSCVTMTVEFAFIMAVVCTVQFPAPATAHENTPAGAAAQAATDGLAPLPTAAHFVWVL